MTENTPDAPAWHLLPYDPEGFFGLSGEFDRKDLKRRYNKLIRQFKPEKFPAEFQKIRAAFEQVDDALRYNTDTRSADTPGPDVDWHSGGDTPSPSDQTPVSPQESDPGPRQPDADAEPEPEPEAQHQALAQEVRETSPEAVFARLHSIEPKNPQTCYQLAILADVVDLPEAGDFLEWICRGLDGSPQDPHLLRLLYAHCHSAAALINPEPMLRRLAGSIGTSEFGYVTEPVWLDLIKTRPFVEFRKLLEDCWQALTDRDLAGRAPLAVRLTRRGLFVADLAWLQGQMEFLWENQGEISEQEFHELDLLMNYRESRAAFLNGDEIRSDVDQLIRNFSELDETEADRAFLAWRVSYQTRGEDILESLSYNGEFILAVTILGWYASEVDERLSDSDLDLSSKRQRTIAVNFINRVDRLTDRSPIGWVSHAFNIVLMFGIPVGLIVAAVGLGKVAESYGINFWPTLIVCILGFAALFLKVILPQAWRLDDVLMDRCHRKIWRHEALRVLDQEPISFHELASTIENDKMMSDMAIANDLVARIYQDPGLAVCSVLRQRSTA